MEKINYIHTENIHNTKDAEAVLPYLFSILDLNVTSMLDIGCGTGSWLSVAKKMGVTNVKGVDGIYVGDSMFCIDKKDFLLHNLTESLDLGVEYDVAISLEVAEHLPEMFAENIVNILSKHSKIILFSAAIPNQGGQNHLNEQPASYWIEKFQNRGYVLFDVLRHDLWNDNNIYWWYRQNMILFVRKEKINIIRREMSDRFNEYIHPDLFQNKIDEIRSLNNQIGNPKVYSSFKKFLKSIYLKFIQ